MSRSTSMGMATEVLQIDAEPVNETTCPVQTQRPEGPDWSFLKIGAVRMSFGALGAGSPPLRISRTLSSGRPYASGKRIPGE